MSPVIITHSGLRLNLLEPDPASICIEDISHALSNLCRFTGHTTKFYSVAEHSLRASVFICEKLAWGGEGTEKIPKLSTDTSLALETLLHDATEAYLGDVSSPLKAQLPEYRLIERNLDLTIRQKFGLPLTQSEWVTHADLVMLATEKRDLVPGAINEHWDYLEGINPLKSKIIPLPPHSAKMHFLSNFKNLISLKDKS